jgi:radical SAM protein with 4Fe4S-binding SPASM domain
MSFVDPNIARKEAFQKTHLAEANSLADGSPVFSEVEFNITGLCNRVCFFCPRVDPEVFPNVNEHLSLTLYEKILNDLEAIDYSGRVSFSGFGEPLLNPKHLELIQMTRRILPDCWLDMVSNGDRITAEKMAELLDSGLTTLLISMYDGPEQIEHFEEMIAQAGVPREFVILRKRYLPPEQGYGINVTNRAGMVTVNEVGVTVLTEPMKHPCYYTHYRMMIDYNGDVILCPHDWGKRLIVGNLNTKSIVELWTGKILMSVRTRLGNGDRNFPPCDKCDVLGTRQGKDHFKAWKEHYQRSSPAV